MLLIWAGTPLIRTTLVDAYEVLTRGCFREGGVVRNGITPLESSMLTKVLMGILGGLLINRSRIGGVRDLYRRPRPAGA